MKHASLMAGFAREVYRDRTSDPGMAAIYTQLLQERDGGDERSFAAMDHDPFFVSAVMDARLYGAHTPHSMMNEFRRVVEEWSAHDPAAVQCPVFLYHGTLDGGRLTRVGSEEALSRVVGKHARTVRMEEHGQTTILLEVHNVAYNMVRGHKATSSYHRSHKLAPGIVDDSSTAARAVLDSVIMTHIAHDHHQAHEHVQAGRDALGLIHHVEEEHHLRGGVHGPLDGGHIEVDGSGKLAGGGGGAGEQKVPSEGEGQGTAAAAAAAADA